MKSGTQLDSHPEIICANYTNNGTDRRFAEFTFKISGLNDFSLNHSDLQIAAMNGSGYFQHNNLPRKCDNLYTEEALLSASRTIGISNGSVGADASLSGKQNFGQFDWSDTENEY